MGGPLGGQGGVMAWIPKWRERVVRNEDASAHEKRTKNAVRVEKLKDKQRKLAQKIQWHEEEYDRHVYEAKGIGAGKRRSGADQKRYLAFAHDEHASELALRAPDRQIFSRLYSKVDRDNWRLDESRYWYNKNASGSVAPDIDLESYGFTAVAKPGDFASGRTLQRWTGPLAQQDFPPLQLAQERPRESISAMQRRVTAHQPPPTPHHWSDFNNHLQSQTAKREAHPLCGRIDLCAPPFRHPPLPGESKPPARPTGDEGRWGEQLQTSLVERKQMAKTNKGGPREGGLF